VNFPFICSIIPAAAVYGVCISYSRCDIPELVVSVGISVMEQCCQQESYLIKGSYLLSWSYRFESIMVITLTWSIVTEYMCHKWPGICSKSRKHLLVLSSFMTYHPVCNWSNTMSLAWQELLIIPDQLSFFVNMHSWGSSIKCFHVFRSVLWWTLRFLSKNDVRFVFFPCCVGSSCFINVICVYLRILVSNTISISDDVCVVKK